MEKRGRQVGRHRPKRGTLSVFRTVTTQVGVESKSHCPPCCRGVSKIPRRRQNSSLDHEFKSHQREVFLAPSLRHTVRSRMDSFNPRRRPSSFVAGQDGRKMAKSPKTAQISLLPTRIHAQAITDFPPVNYRMTGQVDTSPHRPEKSSIFTSGR